MNKIISKEIFVKKKIKTPKFFTLNKKNFNAQGLKKNIIKKKNYVSGGCETSR